MNLHRVLYSLSLVVKWARCVCKEYTAHWSRDGQQVKKKRVSKNSDRALTIFMSYTQYAYPIQLKH